MTRMGLFLFALLAIQVAQAQNIKNEDGTNQVIVDGTADVNRELNNGLLKNRILDVAGLAAVMHKKLVEKDWMDTTEKSAGKYFTSAEFAFQMSCIISQP